ncbi:MAG: hypothetical protein JWN85_3948 [Gammaproteobacteria bacterium]|nr:hypothetical protein [Gammaproteobacteria bacterium]
MPAFERTIGNLRVGSLTVILPPSLIEGVFFSRTPQLTSTVRSKIGSLGVHDTWPVLSTVHPAGP